MITGTVRQLIRARKKETPDVNLHLICEDCKYELIKVCTPIEALRDRKEFKRQHTHHKGFIDRIINRIRR